MCTDLRYLLLVALSASSEILIRKNRFWVIQGHLKFLALMVKTQSALEAELLCCRQILANSDKFEQWMVVMTNCHKRTLWRQNVSIGNEFRWLLRVFSKIWRSWINSRWGVVARKPFTATGFQTILTLRRRKPLIWCRERGCRWSRTRRRILQGLPGQSPISTWQLKWWEPCTKIPN